MTVDSRTLVSPGNALVLIGAGHTGWGLIAYREALRDIARAGVVGTVGEGIYRQEHARGPRAAAFWFVFAGPLISGLGYLTERALRAGDRRAVAASGATTLALGAVGTAVIPTAPFPAAMAIGAWLLRLARRG